jgi:hypothetical protein
MARLLLNKRRRLSAVCAFKINVGNEHSSHWRGSAFARGGCSLGFRNGQPFRMTGEKLVKKFAVMDFCAVCLQRRRDLRFPLGALTLLFSFVSAADAHVLYVDNSLASNCTSGNYSVASRSCAGSDGNGYSTFSAAISAMQAGDTLSIRGGTYSTPVSVNKSGSSTAHLQIAAYAGESAVIDLGGLGSASGIDVSSQRYVDVDRLIVRNSPMYGFKGSNGDHLTLTNSEVVSSHHGGVIFENSSSVVVAGCNIHDNNQGGLGSWHEAISFANVNGFQITNSDVHDNLKEGIDAKYGATNGVISGNRSYKNNGPNIYLDGVNTIQVYGNICHDTVSSNKPCIGLSIESTYNTTNQPTRDVRIYNNTIYGGGAGIWFWVETPSLSWSVFSNIRIEYNTVADNSLNNWGGIYVLGGGSSNFGSGNVIRNNIFWTNSGGAIRDSSGVMNTFTIDHNLFRTGESSSTFGSNAVISSTNPFVNESGRDYHLSGTSPARSIGVPISDVTTDEDGRPRPSSSTDAGAYQYASQTTTAPSAPSNLRIIP